MVKRLGEMVNLPFLFCIAVSIFLPNTLMASTPDVNELIAGYRSAIQPYKCVAYTEISRISRLHDNQAEDPVGRELVERDDQGRALFTSFYRRDHDRLDVLSCKPSITEAEAIHDAKKVRSRIIVLGDLWQTLNSASGTRRGSVTQQSAKLAQIPSSELLANCRSISLTGGEALDGWTTGRRDKSLPDIFASSDNTSLRPQSEIINGHVTWVVTCKTADGEFSAWLDRELKYQPRRIEGRNIGDKKSFDITVDNIEYTTIDDKSVALSAKVTMQSRLSVGEMAETRTLINDYSRSGIEFNPDFGAQKAFVMVAPPEYTAMNMDLPAVRWSLQNGKFVPGVDPSVIHSVDQLVNNSQGSEGSQQPDAENRNSMDRFIANAPLGSLSQSADSAPYWRGLWVWIVAFTLIFAIAGVLIFRKLRGNFGQKRS